MSTFPFQCDLICTAERQPDANQLAILVAPPGEHDTFCVPLSPTGQEPATHYATTTPASQQMIEESNATLADTSNGVASWLTFYTRGRFDNLLIGTNGTDAAKAAIGQPWSWLQSLADAGLQVIRPTLPGMGE